MTLDLAKLRAETLALLDGTTPGPWWTDGKYDGREMGCAIIAARTDAGPLPGNPTRGMVAFSSAITNTQARGCEANARLIAAAPALAADTLRLLDEIERLRAENNKLRDDMSGGSFYQEDDIDAMQNEIERLRSVLQDIVESWDWWTVDEYDRDRGGLADSIPAARAALAEGGPYDH